MSASGSEDSLWQSYKETIIEISRNNILLNDRQLYEVWNKDFYMITAANPFSGKLTDKKNELRNLELYSILAYGDREILASIGRNTTRTWAEKGWVVCEEEEKLILLAKEFEQNAIFKFTAQGREIIDCR